jgi:hypothetical protein
MTTKWSDDNDFSVDFRKPPKHSQFKPGQSGNPKGRPKGIKNAAKAIADVLNEKIAVRIGDKVRRIPKFEAILQSISAKALKGDAKSALVLIKLASEHGLLLNQQTKGIMNIRLVSPDKKT